MKTIMLSGANRGIGLAIARQLYQDGYQLSLGIRNPQQLPTVLQEMSKERVTIFQYEAKDMEAARQWTEHTLSQFNHIDGLINCAGVLRSTSLENYNELVLDELWTINVKAVVRLVHSTLPYLKSSGQGRVINLVSLSGKRVKGRSFGYGMTKHALMALTHSIRHTGWKHGIRATAILPGWVNTDMVKEFAIMPVEQMTQPEEIAKITSLLLSLPNEASVAEIPINCVLEDTI
ncbi:MAG: SDR family NAD(P)-dependent oxidoreductase [Pseudomonadota bacterium]